MALAPHKESERAPSSAQSATRGGESARKENSPFAKDQTSLRAFFVCSRNTREGD